MEKRHGSPYDRGSADAYYHRPKDPHYYKKASYSSDRVDKKDMSDEQKAEYLLGYYETTDRKDFGEFDMNKCVICNGPIEVQKTPEGKVFWDKGHNARPVAEGQCCTSCNHSVVIPARLGRSINA